MINHQKKYKCSFKIYAVITYLLLPFIFILSSCPTPFDDTYVLQVMDEEGPQITITYPLDGTPYAKTVVVEGYITDSAGNTGEDGKVISLSYEILGTSERGDVFLYEDNSFRFQFDTIFFDKAIIVKLMAVDWNGNSGVKTITLINAGNDIPSFVAFPGNHQVTLTWDPVPLTESYSIYYTFNGNTPSEYYGERTNVQDGTECTIDNLDNGFLHMFQLHAHSLEGEEKDNRSAIIMTIPLSKTTLTPEVTGEYRRICVEWNPLSVPDWLDAEYEIYRSIERDGDFIYLRTVKTNSFVDTNVIEGELYFYKIKEGLSKIESMVSSGRTSPFPDEKTEQVAHCPEPHAMGVAVVDDYAFVGQAYTGDNGLKVIDLDSTSPTYREVVGSYSTTWVWDIAVNGNYAYLADSDGGLQIIDISTPTSPQFAGSYPNASICGVAISGNYAYVSDYADPIEDGNPAGLKVIDITPAWDGNPVTQPFLVGECPTNEAWGVSVSGNYAYVADRHEGLVVIDITEPTQVDNNSWVGACQFLNAWDVTVKNGYAYVSGHNKGLKVIDVTDPENLDEDYIVGFYDTYKAIYSIVTETYVYVADFNAGLKIIEIPDSYPIPPTSTENPPLELNIVGSARTDEAWGLYVDGNNVYIADGAGGLKVIRTIIPKVPEVMDSCILGEAKGVAVNDDLAYVANGGGGFVAIDVDASNPEYPQIIGTCPTDDAQRVAVSGRYAYVADGMGGLRVIDINVNSSTYLEAIGLCETFNARDVAVSGDYAYIADYDEGIKVIDISNPESPEVVGYYSTYRACGIEAKGSYIFIADFYGGLIILDVSNPRIPLFTGGCTEDMSGAWSVAVKENYAYVADHYDNDRGPRAVNISDPSNPSTEWAEDFLGRSSSVAVAGTYLYVTVDTPNTAENVGLYIFDIYNPDSPMRIGNCTTIVNAHDVAINGQNAYIADGVEGLKIIDLLNED